MKWIINNFFPKTKRVGILAAIFSLISSAIIGTIVSYFMYKKIPVYEELVLGYSTWNGYYKQGDMNLAYYVIFSVIFFYLTYSFIMNNLLKKTGFLSVMKEEKVLSDKNKEIIFECVKFINMFIFLQFSFTIFARIITILVPEMYVFVDRTFLIFQGTLFLAVIFLVIMCKKNKWNKIYDGILFYSQLLLPLVFILITYYEYTYKGNIIVQYKSVKNMIVGIVISVILILYVISKKRRNKETTIYLSTFLSVAVFASYQLPRGMISGEPVEFYHYGELSVPLHQFLEFGTIPYLDTMPIHGVCDYFQAAVWYGLFDGTYATFEAAMVIGCVIIAVVTSAICYYFIESKTLGLLCVLFFSLFGDQYYYVRWAFALPSIIIVFSKQARQDFSKMLWYWTFISILSIAWNPSIGGTCAIAMLPMIIWEGFHEKGYLDFVKLWKDKKEKKIWIFSYLFLFILGISFIPMFFAILRYIVENSAAILETTGDMLRVELINPYIWYATFGFVISILCSFYFLIHKKGDEKKLSAYAILFLLIFNSVIVRYTFVRTQFGERGIIATTICNLFFVLMILTPSVKKTWKKESVGLLLVLFVITIGTKGANLIKMPLNILERGEISEEYKYVRGEKESIPSLGNIYIKEELEQELMELNYIANELCGKDYQYVDMTNELAHYNILNKKVLLPFSSTYNTNNEVMQKKAIEVLNEREPEVIVVAPGWGHDSGPLSTRNYYLYQWIMDHDYVPCKYESIIFFTNEEKIKESFEPAYDELEKNMEIENWKKVPMMWSSDIIEEKYTENLPLKTNLAETNSVVIKEDCYQVTMQDSYYLFSFEEPLGGENLDFVRIIMEDTDSKEVIPYKGVLHFYGEEDLKEITNYYYTGESKEVLIPVSTDPKWNYSKEIKIMKLELSGEQLAGKNINIKFEFEEYIGIKENY